MGIAHDLKLMAAALAVAIIVIVFDERQADDDALL